jgi:hypothetical protein
MLILPQTVSYSYVLAIPIALFIIAPNGTMFRPYVGEVIADGRVHRIPVS